MKSKGEATAQIRAYVAVIEKKFGQTPRYQHFDNGKELVNKEVEKWPTEKGIIIETTVPYSPSQHGAAERFNHTLLELAHTMLIEKNLPPFLWPEAVAHMTYIQNCLPTQALDGKTPHEAWTGKKPDVSHFCEFGCDAWVLNSVAMAIADVFRKNAISMGRKFAKMLHIFDKIDRIESRRVI